MKTDGSPKVTFKNTRGEELKFSRYDKATGTPIKDSNGTAIEMGNCYVDPTGNIVPTPEIVPYYTTESGKFIQAVKNHKTEVFEITKWEPIKNYLDKYIIDAYYVIKPSQGKSKADVQRKLNIKVNVKGMKKLYDHMINKGIVGRGVLNVTSSGYLPSIAYVRPVREPNDSKDTWALEIGVFKQQKRFTYTLPNDIDSSVPDTTSELMEEVTIPSIDEI
jgi:hypothetical protein